MRVLVDTNVWSLALRRDRSSLSAEELAFVSELADLVREGRVILVGFVRQEILSGLGDPGRFARLRDRLAAFEDERLRTDDHVRAAEMSNICRGRGIQSSPIDILLCAVAERTGASVFTADGSFETFSQHLPFELHAPRSNG